MKQQIRTYQIYLEVKDHNKFHKAMVLKAISCLLKRIKQTIKSVKRIYIYIYIYMYIVYYIYIYIYILYILYCIYMDTEKNIMQKFQRSSGKEVEFLGLINKILC